MIFFKNLSTLGEASIELPNKLLTMQISQEIEGMSVEIHVILPTGKTEHVTS